MSDVISGSGEGMSFPPITVDGFAVATELADQLSTKIGDEIGTKPPVDERAAILEILAPGASYFYELARAAGELAGSGDPLGALALLGERNARDMLGDEETDALIAEAAAQMHSPSEDEIS